MHLCFVYFLLLPVALSLLLCLFPFGIWGSATWPEKDFDEEFFD